MKALILEVKEKREDIRETQEHVKRAEESLEVLPCRFRNTSKSRDALPYLERPTPPGRLTHVSLCLALIAEESGQNPRGG